MSYVELHTASAFSFLQGASLPEAIVDRAAELGYRSIALLDRDGVYGIPRFHKAACAAGIRPLVGAELTLTLLAPDRQEVLERERPEAGREPLPRHLDDPAQRGPVDGQQRVPEIEGDGVDLERPGRTHPRTALDGQIARNGQ